MSIVRESGNLFVPDRCVPSATGFSDTVSMRYLSRVRRFLAACKSKENAAAVSLHIATCPTAAKKHQSPNQNIGTGVDRGHLTRKRWKTLFQKIGFCEMFLVVEGTLASCLAVSMDMCSKCAPARAVHHQMMVTRNWRNNISSRQDKVTLSSVSQSAGPKNVHVRGNWLQNLLEFRTAKM